MNCLITLLILVLTLSVGTTRLNAQNVNIPDANFKAYLLGNTIINANGDTEIQITEAANYTSSMNCYSLNISDLTGIEAFPNLDALNCALNNLTSLDLSQNTSLTEVICESNNLTSLILPTTGNLFTIECRFNQITTLDLSQVPSVSVLNAEGSGLYNLDLRNGNNGYFSNTSFNVTNNPNLSCVNVDDAAYSTANWTNIDAGASFSTNCSAPPALVNIPDANFKAYLVGNTAINTNGNTEIEVSEAAAFGGTIDCSSQNIVELTGIEEFVLLTTLDCSSNNLTSLVLSQNTSLTALDCNSNSLSSLNVKNNNNTNFTTFDATNNSGLSCIEVDAVAYSTANWTNIDAGTSFSTNCVPAVVNIPDANFKTNLLNNTAINTNGDGAIQVTEAIAFTGTINCSSTGLINVTGLEAFVNLTGFTCTNNAQLLSLDVSQNVNLLTLNCSNNYQLGSLSANNNLQTLTCTGTDMYGIFVSNITGLVTLNCSSNNISNLNVSQNTNLVNLNCSLTDITTLDLSNNPNLEVFQCDFNNLTSLDVRNGNNTIITNFQVNFGSLSCVDVDNVAYSTANWTNVDAGTLFSLNCNGAPVVNIPDANFKAYLVGNIAINTDGDTEIQVSEAIAFSGAMNCSNFSISNLTGIEAFVNLTELNCENNTLNSLNVTQNTSLTSLNCSGNNLSSLDLTQNTSLITLNGSDNDFTSLDLSQNTSLTTLNCSSNNLSNLDVSQNTSLTSLDCSANNLNALEVSLNTSLTALNCSSNNLSSLEVKNGNNANFTSFDATNNPNLGCIDVDNAAYSTANWTNIDGTTSFSANCSAQNVYIPDVNFKAYLVGNTAINTNGDAEIQVSEALAFTGTLNCSANSITDLTGIEAFVNLNQLRCYRNNLTGLDVSQNTSLTQLYCYNNQISSINLSQNTNLVLLHCVNNSISNIDLTQNTNLTTLYCSNNPMYNLDLSQNTSLRVIDCAGNQLSSLDMKNGNNTNVTTFRATSNPLLTCINVDDVAYSTANWTDVDASVSFNLNCSSVAPVIYIPDANFKAYLVGNTAINTDGDSEIQFSEAAAFTGKIDCYNISATSLVGVEEFINLTELDCSFNNIGSLDLTQNVDLESLDYSGTGLMSLDLSQNTALKTLLCASIATGSSLLSLDVSNNVNLESLSCDNNALTVLDLTQNTSLTTLHCYANQITSLDLSQNPNLAILNCSYNAITSLDISQNTNLVSFSCVENQLTSLDAKNGNNTIITFFGATTNPNLTCIKVDDVAYSTTNWTNIDATASFDANCIAPDPIVNIPDANFKAYLVGNTAINTDGDTEIQFSEATAFSGVINCPNSSIADLTGIEAFVNVTQLKCYNNSLTSLDVSQNTNLVVLHCVNNSISSLDVSQNTSLTQLFCSNNPISSLDVSQSTNLGKLYCGLTQITNLDVSQNTNLKTLDCTSSALSSLNVKNGNNTNFTTFKATNNPNLTCIEVDNPTYSTANWTNIDATSSFNSICIVAAPIVNIPDANFKAYLVANTAINTDGDAEIQVTEATAFTGVINCPNSNITDLTGIEAFVNLTQLKCYNNNLGSLDVSQNTSLTWIHCVNSSLSSLDVSQNTSLIWLYCSNNPINSLDLTQNTSLTKLYCSGAQLTTLNVKNGNNTNIATFKVTNNPNLTCIGVDDAAYSTTNWTDIDASASFSTSCIVLAPTVNIPDANFKAYLVGNTAINTDGDAEIQVSEATAFSGAINCSNLSITVLTGIEAFENLIELNCSSNTIGSLDLTQNNSLTIVDCSSNQLNNLTVKNGNNTNVTSFDATGNSSLGCIEVDNGTYSTTNWTNIDATASFSANCGAPTVNIPDANFKAYLVGNTSINTDGDGEIQVTEATAFNGVINCPGSNISDLTGIEAFVNVRQLKCYNNNISSLDLSQNTSLTWLHCVKNSISSLDLSQNTGLTWLYCSNNPIGSLDLTQNTSLTRLYCSATQLSSLTMKNGNNAAITTFQVTSNPNLTCIEVDDVAYSTANWADIDAIASFSTNCIVPMVNGSNANLGGNNTGVNANGAVQGSETSTNINTINKAINLKAYPNPATKEITLDFGKSYQEATIQVTNLTGQLVLSKTLTNSARATLELEGPTGIYFVSIQTEEGKATLKVIKE